MPSTHSTHRSGRDILECDATGHTDHLDVNVTHQVALCTLGSVTSSNALIKREDKQKGSKLK